MGSNPTPSASVTLTFAGPRASISCSRAAVNVKITNHRTVPTCWPTIYMLRRREVIAALAPSAISASPASTRLLAGKPVNGRCGVVGVDPPPLGVELTGVPDDGEELVAGVAAGLDDVPVVGPGVEVADAAAVGVPLGPGVTRLVGVVVDDGAPLVDGVGLAAAAQTPGLIVFVSKVTAPFRASSRPWNVAAV